jgi:hypothetical protein
LFKVFTSSSAVDFLYNEKGSWLDRTIPSGWIYQNQLNVDRFYTEVFLPGIDSAHRRINPSKMKQVDHAIETMRATPYTVLSKDLLSVMTTVTKRAAASQAYLDEAVVACALDRYRLVHGEFPENLDAITPQFIAKLPPDVVNGEPLHYHRTADGQYVLYSVGWNETDDGGQVARPTGTYQDLDQGDWVWFSQPQPPVDERK